MPTSACVSKHSTMGCMRVGTTEAFVHSHSIESADVLAIKSCFKLPTVVHPVTSLRLSHRPINIVPLVLQAFIALVIAIFGNNLGQFLQPTKRGFFCDDTSIRFPYHDSTVSFIKMLVVAFVVILIIIFFTEIMCLQTDVSKSGSIDCDDELYQVAGYILNPSLVRCIQFLTLGLVGYGISMLVTTVVKNVFGRLRPNFHSICSPNVSTCEPLHYYDNYACQSNYSEYYIKEVHLSFPSGHTAAAFYFAVFTIIYIHYRLRRWARVWTPMFICIYWFVFAVAALVGVSRIMDNKHHATDVLFGALLGAGVASSVLLCNKSLLCSGVSNVKKELSAASDVIGKELISKRAVELNKTCPS